jgi:hypothetical protein
LFSSPYDEPSSRAEIYARASAFYLAIKRVNADRNIGALDLRRLGMNGAGG